jgi:hypothetical protein
MHQEADATRELQADVALDPSMAGAPPETWANSQARFNAGVARAALGDVLAATRDADALQQSAPELAAQLRQFTASRAAAR